MSQKIKAKKNEQVNDRQKGRGPQPDNLPQSRLKQVLQQGGNRALQRVLAQPGADMKESTSRGMPLTEKLTRAIQHGMGNAVQREPYSEDEETVAPEVEQGWAQSTGVTSNMMGDYADPNALFEGTNQNQGGLTNDAFEGIPPYMVQDYMRTADERGEEYSEEGYLREMGTAGYEEYMPEEI